ncbi:hypothetical protein C2G38_2080944 [Gigaspora rosea]|uniref:Uncharacterized protein n=1 Tax=Gigaspora rosea TaxID=44941 RepID=A0A397VEG7_9GLOM|nr:hypothetical protein C2G38_2080944 [Gigaspora rosea]
MFMVVRNDRHLLTIVCLRYKFFAFVLYSFFSMKKTFSMFLEGGHLFSTHTLYLYRFTHIKYYCYFIVTVRFFLYTLTF